VLVAEGESGQASEDQLRSLRLTAANFLPTFSLQFGATQRACASGACVAQCSSAGISAARAPLGQQQSAACIVLAALTRSLLELCTSTEAAPANFAESSARSLVRLHFSYAASTCYSLCLVVSPARSKTST